MAFTSTRRTMVLLRGLRSIFTSLLPIYEHELDFRLIWIYLQNVIDRVLHLLGIPQHHLRLQTSRNVQFHRFCPDTDTLQSITSVKQWFDYLSIHRLPIYISISKTIFIRYIWSEISTKGRSCCCRKSSSSCFKPNSTVLTTLLSCSETSRSC